MDKYILNKTGKNFLSSYNSLNSLMTRFGFERAIDKDMGNHEYEIGSALEIINAEGPGTMDDITGEVGLDIWEDLKPYLMIQG